MPLSADESEGKKLLGETVHPEIILHSSHKYLLTLVQDNVTVLFYIIYDGV